MRLVVNGEPRECLSGTTVAQLVATLGLDRHRIAVEVNKGVLSREKYDEQSLEDGDAVEIVQFVGGG